jgi:hypothetical protein
MMSKVFSVTLGTMLIFASSSYVSAQSATPIARTKPHCGVACDYRCSCYQCKHGSCPWMMRKHHFPAYLRRSIQAALIIVRHSVLGARETIRRCPRRVKCRRRSNVGQTGARAALGQCAQRRSFTSTPANSAARASCRTRSAHSTAPADRRWGNGPGPS